MRKTIFLGTSIIFKSKTKAKKGSDRLRFVSLISISREVGR